MRKSPALHIPKPLPRSRGSKWERDSSARLLYGTPKLKWRTNRLVLSPLSGELKVIAAVLYLRERAAPAGPE